MALGPVGKTRIVGALHIFSVLATRPALRLCASLFPPLLFSFSFYIQGVASELGNLVFGQ